MSENPPFDISNFPHIQDSIPTFVEGGGLPGPTPFVITVDFDDEMRDTLRPDIGADEGAFTPRYTQLAHFAARAHGSAARVLIDWRTRCEFNSLGFRIERRVADETQYTDLGLFIPGHGTTNLPNSYSAVDSSLSRPGLYQYRLCQVSIDSSKQYLDTVSVMVIITDAESPLPFTFNLRQNYPNPFNPTTTIEYALPKQSHVKLEIYNVLGERIATLVKEPKPAGHYRHVFDATGLASGLYLYRISAGEFVAVKKLIVLR